MRRTLRCLAWGSLVMLLATSVGWADCGSDCSSSCSSSTGKAYEDCMVSCIQGCQKNDPPPVPKVPEPTPVK